MKIQKDYFKSSDIAVCSYLCCEGYMIEKIERQESGKATFFIEKDDRLDNLINSYFTHQAKADPLVFFNSLKELKVRIYNL